MIRLHRGILNYNFALFMSVLCAFSVLAFADTIYLKSGETVEGKICRETDEKIAIVTDTEMGIMTASFPRKDIEKIEETKGDEGIIEICAKSIFYFQQANAHYNAKDYHQAIDNYKRVIELNPKWAEAYYNLGLAHAGLGQYQEARENLNQALELAVKVRKNTPDNKKFIKRTEKQIRELPQ